MKDSIVAENVRKTFTLSAKQKKIEKNQEKFQKKLAKIAKRCIMK